MIYWILVILPPLLLAALLISLLRGTPQLTEEQRAKVYGFNLQRLAGTGPHQQRHAARQAMAEQAVQRRIDRRRAELLARHRRREYTPGPVPEVEAVPV